MAFGGTFQQGLSGLSAAQRGLEVIANNVSNANVVGFKSSQAQFSDVFARAFSGGAGNNNVGLGTQLSGVQQSFKQGNLSVTGNPLDLGINGEGFFKMDSINGEKIYTRNGQFKLDSSGNVVNNRGDFLLGFPVDQATLRPTDNPARIQIPQAAIPPSSTKATSLELNLDARKTVITDPFDPANLATYNNSTSMTVYDQLGNSHVFSVYFRKTDAATNTWETQATLDGTAIDMKDDKGTAVSNSIKFNADGTLDTTASNGKFQIDLTKYVSSPNGGEFSTEAPPLAANTFTFYMSKITQFGSAFSVQNLSQDGYESSPYSGFDIADNGTLKVNYANGQSKEVAKIGLFKFKNPEGLQPLGSNGWLATDAAGPELVSLSDETSFGVIQSGALEEANVDLTAELVAMISAQRVYQANSQSIKTQDSLLQTISNLR